VSAVGDLCRLQEIIDASGVSPQIESRLPIGVRPRQLAVRTLLIGILATLADKRPAHLARIHEALICLPEADKWRLGVTCSWKSGPHELTYRQTERTFHLLVKALSKDRPDGKPCQTLSDLMDALIEGSVKVLGGGRAPQSSSYAIDWSDYESFARPPRKRRGKAQGPDAQPAQNAASAPRPTEAQDAAQQADGPQQDEAGNGTEQETEKERCADPEAAWGHRKTNHPGTSETFFGYYLQAVTIVREENGGDVPELVRRVTLASPKHDPPAMIVPVIQRMHEDGIEIADLLGDSGYSYRAPETFAMPARALGASLVIDLHPGDRGMKGTHEGATCCNGNLYCPATPKALFALGPASPAATEKELAAHDQKTAELSRYKLSPLTAADQDGYRRLACPAVKGKLRCPLRASSMSLSHERPTITDPPEHPPLCCSQQTITVAPTVNAKTAQKHDYPSKAHRASYARRTASERSFSQVCDPASIDIKRGWCRLMGLTGPTLLLTCAFIIANIRTADAFTARQAENQRRAACGLPPRRRRRRRRSLHDLTSHANAPPTIAA
jgi:hypothetical protein